MSEFGDRIRVARVSAKPAKVVLAARSPVSVQAPPQSKPSADPGVSGEATHHPAQSDAGLEDQLRRAKELSRKIAELNTAVLHEILRRPSG